MKLALISDIHGNLFALEAALADIETQAVDGIACLGDVANFGALVRETLARVESLACPVVMGNTDASLLTPQTLEDIATPNEDDAFFIGVEGWCAEQVTERDKTFIRSFKATLELELDGLDVLLFHGSPRSYNDLIMATTADSDLEQYFVDAHAMVMVGGHAHAQLLRRYKGSLIINPGSIGLPYEYPWGETSARTPPWAEYAVLEVRRGQPSVTFRRVPYDVARYIQAVRASGMPYVEKYLESFLH